MARDASVSSPVTVVITVMALVKCVLSVQKVFDILNLSRSLSTSQERSQRTDKGKKKKTYGTQAMTRPYELSWLVWEGGRVGVARMMPDGSQMSSPCSSGCVEVVQ
jgi:hypothetical protein